MSKFIEKMKMFVNSIGVYRVILFLLCGWMTSIGLTFGTMGGALAFLIVAVVTIVKVIATKQFDFPNLYAAILGVIFAWLFYVPVDYFII